MKIKVLFLLSILSSHLYANELVMRESRADYVLNQNVLKGRSIQYFYEMISPDGKSLDEQYNYENTNQSIINMQKIDLSSTLKNINLEDWYRLYTRVSFVVHKPASFFDSNRACDIEVNESVAQVAAKGIKLREVGDCEFKQRGGIFIPRQRIKIDYIDDMAILNSLPITGEIVAAKYQEHSDFSRVFFYKAGHFSTVVTQFSKIAENKTLIDIHTYHLLYSIPPNIGGGADWVREQIVKQYPKLKVVYDQL